MGCCQNKEVGESITTELFELFQTLQLLKIKEEEEQQIVCFIYIIVNTGITRPTSNLNLP